MYSWDVIERHLRDQGADPYALSSARFGYLEQMRSTPLWNQLGDDERDYFASSFLAAPEFKSLSETERHELVNNWANTSSMWREMPVDKRKAFRQGLVNAPGASPRMQPPEEPLTSLWDVAAEAAQRGHQQAKLARQTVFGAEPGEVAETLQRLEQSPQAAVMQDVAGTKTLGEFLGAVAEDPLAFAADTLLSSGVAFGESALGLGALGGKIGTALGPEGTAAGGAIGAGLGTGLGSLALEYSGEFYNTLADSGVDVTSPQQLAEALQDEDLVSEARISALKKGVPVAVFDALSAGIAGKLLAPARGPLGKVATGAGELAIQAGLGGLGEAAGQVVQKGEVYDPASVYTEVFAEVPGGIGEIALGAARRAPVVAGEAGAGAAQPANVQESAGAGAPAEVVAPVPSAAESAPVPAVPVAEPTEVDVVKARFENAPAWLADEEVRLRWALGELSDEVVARRAPRFAETAGFPEVQQEQAVADLAASAEAVRQQLYEPRQLVPTEDVLVAQPEEVAEPQQAVEPQPQQLEQPPAPVLKQPAEQPQRVGEQQVEPAPVQEPVKPQPELPQTVENQPSPAAETIPRETAAVGTPEAQERLNLPQAQEKAPVAEPVVQAAEQQPQPPAPDLQLKTGEPSGQRSRSGRAVVVPERYSPVYHALRNVQEAAHAVAQSRGEISDVESYKVNLVEPVEEWEVRAVEDAKKRGITLGLFEPEYDTDVPVRGVHTADNVILIEAGNKERTVRGVSAHEWVHEMASKDRAAFDAATEVLLKKSPNEFEQALKTAKDAQRELGRQDDGVKIVEEAVAYMATESPERFWRTFEEPATTAAFRRAKEAMHRIVQRLARVVGLKMPDGSEYQNVESAWRMFQQEYKRSAKRNARQAGTTKALAPQAAEASSQVQTPVVPEEYRSELEEASARLRALRSQMESAPPGEQTRRIAREIEDAREDLVNLAMDAAGEEGDAWQRLFERYDSGAETGTQYAVKTKPEEPAPQGKGIDDLLDIGVKGRIGRFWANANVAVEQLEEYFGRETDKDPRSVYLAAGAFTARVSNRLKAITKRLVEPLMADIARSQIDAKTINEFLIATHAFERNAHIRSINIDRPRAELTARLGKIKDQSGKRAEAIKKQLAEIDRLEQDHKAGVGPHAGMTDDAAAKLLNDMRAKGDVKFDGEPGVDTVYSGTLGQIRSRVNALSAEKLRLLQSYGLVSAQELAHWKKYKNYVPLKGVSDPMAALMGREGYADFTASPGSGTGFSIVRNEKRSTGRYTMPTNDVVAQLSTDVANALARGERNRVGQKLLQLAEDLKQYKFSNGKRIFEVGRVIVTDGGKKKRIGFSPQRRYFNEATQMVESVPDGYAARRDDVVSVYVNGEQHLVKINHPAFASAVKSLGTAELGTVLGQVSKLVRMMARLNTNYNPSFIPVNFFRDLGMAFVMLSKNEVKHLRSTTFRQLPSAMKTAAAMSELLGRTVAPPKGKFKQTKADGSRYTWKDYWEEYTQSGGKVGFFLIPNIDEQVKKLQKMAEDALRGKGDPLKYFNALKQLMEDANQSIENGARFSSFVAARESGWTTDRAARLSRGLTVDFNRRGTHSAVIGSMFMFFNAGIQGTIAATDALVNNPGSRNVLLATSAAAIGYALAASAVMGDDDDGIPYWDKIPQYVKDHNIIIYNPLGKDGSYFKFPLPYGFNILWSAGVTAADVMRGAKSPGEGALDVMSSVVGALNPFGASDLTKLRGWVQAFTPTVARPAVDVAVNLNFYGGPVSKKPSEFTRLPQSETYFSSATPISRSVARFLNRITGGTPVSSGALDLSPDDLDYLIRGYLGGAGQFAVQLVAVPWRQFTSDEQIPVRSYPVVYRFLGEQAEWYTSQAYYANKESVEKRIRELEYFKEKSPQEYREWREKYGTITQLEEPLKRVNKKIQEAKKAGDEDRVEQLMKSFNKLYKEAEK